MPEYERMSIFSVELNLLYQILFGLGLSLISTSSFISKGRRNLNITNIGALLGVGPSY